MTKFLLKQFEKHTSDSKQYQYGTRASIVGILCNVFLFLLKLIIGLLSHSISIVTDAFNNLSDSLNSIVTLIGIYFAHRPADSKHPFGHGRSELIAGFFVENMIVLFALELLLQSIRKLQNPVPTHLSTLMYGFLIISILVKLWLSHFHKVVADKIKSVSLKASSLDARNDVFITLGTLIAVFFNQVWPTIPFDGIMGILVAIVILWSGISMGREIIDSLLGRAEDEQLVAQIQMVARKYPEVKDLHDIMIHSYGNESLFGIAHAEMDESMSLLRAHEIIDRMEKEIQEQYHINMTFHIDPMNYTDQKTFTLRNDLQQILHEVDARLDVHDFRVLYQQNKKQVSCDIEIKDDIKIQNSELFEIIASKWNQIHPDTHFIVSFDRGHTTERFEDEDEK